MAAYNKFNQFVLDLADGIHDFGHHAFKLMLTNTAPSASANKVKSDITEISAGNGYTAGGVAVAGTSVTDTSGTVTFAASDLNPAWTASGGSVGPFEYFVLYNASAVLQPPVQSAPSTSAAGGSIAAGTYYYRVTATNAAGETLGSNEQSITTTGSTSTNTINWAQTPNATGYKVYRATASNGQYSGSALVGTIGSGSTVTFSDTAAAGSAGTVPVTSTATFGPLVAWWDYGSALTLASGETMKWVVSGNTNSAVYTLS